MQLNVCGGRGGGKSALELMIALDRYQKDIPIWLNFHTEFPTNKLNVDTLITQDLRSALIDLDEAYLYLPSTGHRSRLNELTSFMIWQSRKRYVDSVFAYGYNTLFDPSIRSSADMYIICEAIPPFERNPTFLLYTFKIPREWTGAPVYDLSPYRTINEVAIDFNELKGSGVLDLYDTDQLLPIYEILGQRAEAVTTAKDTEGLKRSWSGQMSNRESREEREKLLYRDYPKEGTVIGDRVQHWSMEDIEKIRRLHPSWQPT